MAPCQDAGGSSILPARTVAKNTFHEVFFVVKNVGKKEKIDFKNILTLFAMLNEVF